MKANRISIALLFLATVLFNVLLLGNIEEKSLQINCFPYETAYENLRAHTLPAAVADSFLEAADSNMDVYSELLAMYFGTDCTVTEAKILQQNISFVKKYRPADFEEIKSYVYALWSNLERFPVGEVLGDMNATVTFSDSWMQSRTYGGERGHEGTDIMASVNERGIYPIYSISGGVVENIGWLRLGGWRIGIRSESGAYFYYAHMAEYAKDFQVGEQVSAGTFLGFMGDTGYSDTPGTYGNFPVHLHLGMYLKDKNGTEFSVNSYPMMRYLLEKQNSECM